ncbi:MAG: ferrochelatase [Planctomycetaceae bacterium]
MNQTYDAVLIVGFGGPESPDDVIPFLENVLRGRNVPRERMLEVAEHYYHMGGKSPINDQVRALISVLRPELDAHGITLPIYWGNRNWHPMLADTLREMADAGVKRAIAVVLAAYSSYSSCRQYREDIERAREAVGPNAPQVDKIRVFYNHPEFIAANTDRLREAIGRFPPDRQAGVHVAFTAHSIPNSMADFCDYVKQLEETIRLTTEPLQISQERYKLVYQSRSGRPTDPWLEPDICDHLTQLADRGVRDVVIAPIGFLSDHMEVIYDLDCEARQKAEELGVTMVRAATVGTHPIFVQMWRELIEERLNASSERRSVGQFQPAPDVCRVGCCPAPARPAQRP